MSYEWNTDKNKKNFKKHGIRFEEACLIFKNDVFTWTDERKDYNEIRKVSIGSLGDEIIIVVVHTDRNNLTRIISARLANKTERRIYNEHIKKTS